MHIKNIKTIEDNNTAFDKVSLKDLGNIGRLTPHCDRHGALNCVSLFEGGKMWRCLQEKCRAGCIAE